MGCKLSLSPDDEVSQVDNLPEAADNLPERKLYELKEVREVTPPPIETNQSNFELLNDALESSPQKNEEDNHIDEGAPARHQSGRSKSSNTISSAKSLSSSTKSPFEEDSSAIPGAVPDLPSETKEKEDPISNEDAKGHSNPEQPKLQETPLKYEENSDPFEAKKKELKQDDELDSKNVCIATPQKEDGKIQKEEKELFQKDFLNIIPPPNERNSENEEQSLSSDKQNGNQESKLEALNEKENKYAASDLSENMQIFDSTINCALNDKERKSPDANGMSGSDELRVSPENKQDEAISDGAKTKISKEQNVEANYVPSPEESVPVSISDLLSDSESVEDVACSLAASSSGLILPRPITSKKKKKLSYKESGSSSGSSVQSNHDLSNDKMEEGKAEPNVISTLKKESPQDYLLDSNTNQVVKTNQVNGFVEKGPEKQTRKESNEAAPPNYDLETHSTSGIVSNQNKETEVSAGKEANSRETALDNGLSSETKSPLDVIAETESPLPNRNLNEDVNLIIDVRNGEEISSNPNKMKEQKGVSLADNGDTFNLKNKEIVSDFEEIQPNKNSSNSNVVNNEKMVLKSKADSLSKIFVNDEKESMQNNIHNEISEEFSDVKSKVHFDANIYKIDDGHAAEEPESSPLGSKEHLEFSLNASNYDLNTLFKEESIDATINISSNSDSSNEIIKETKIENSKKSVTELNENCKQISNTVNDISFNEEREKGISVNFPEDNIVSKEIKESQIKNQEYQTEESISTQITKEVLSSDGDASSSKKEEDSLPIHLPIINGKEENYDPQESDLPEENTQLEKFSKKSDSSSERQFSVLEETTKRESLIVEDQPKQTSLETIDGSSIEKTEVIKEPCSKSDLNENSKKGKIIEENNIENIDQKNNAIAKLHNESVDNSEESSAKISHTTEFQPSNGDKEKDVNERPNSIISNNNVYEKLGFKQEVKILRFENKQIQDQNSEKIDLAALKSVSGTHSEELEKVNNLINSVYSEDNIEAAITGGGTNGDDPLVLNDQEKIVQNRTESKKTRREESSRSIYDMAKQSSAPTIKRVSSSPHSLKGSPLANKSGKSTPLGDISSLNGMEIKVIGHYQTKETIDQDETDKESMKAVIVTY